VYAIFIIINGGEELKSDYHDERNLTYNFQVTHSRSREQKQNSDIYVGKLFQDVASQNSSTMKSHTTHRKFMRRLDISWKEEVDMRKSGEETV